MANGWTPTQPLQPLQPPQPTWTPPAGPSGMLKAGTIILLVSAILEAAGAFFLVAAGLVLLMAGRNFVGDGQTNFPFQLVGMLYLVFGVLLVVGCIFGFRAWGRAKDGNARGAWVLGLVASLLPPLQILMLVGAILCLVSPEGDAQGRQPR